ncbi:MAG: GNAT family N-acetyltransferase [Acidimicrobiales bacterium]
MVHARCELCDEPIELSPGVTVTLRHGEPSDADGLADLYGRLRPEDIRRRFFSGASPPRSFFERWSSIADEGGFGLVAELDDGDERHLVAEAGYAPTPKGDGELGIAVDPAHRGWMGPWMLDRLMAHAAARGIDNLQAMVMVDNRLMLSLAKRRGFAVLGHPDWNTIVVTMSTTGPVPGWTGDHERPRVLVETDRTRWRGEEAVAQAGYDIALCTVALRAADECTTGGQCALLDDGSCPLVSGADVVIVDLPSDDEELLGALRQEQIVHPGLRIVAGRDRADGDRQRRPVDEIVAELRTGDGPANQPPTE